MDKQTSIYPMRIVLRVTRRVVVGHHPAAMVAALIKNAAGRAELGDGMPVGMMPDAVEVGRMVFENDEPFAFGLNVWGDNQRDCQRRFGRLIEGLQHIGSQSRSSKALRHTRSSANDDAPPRIGAGRKNPTLPGGKDEMGLRGNFVVSEVQSLVDPDSEQLVAIPDIWIDQMVELSKRASNGLTLRWLSPLCAQLPPRFGKHNDQPDSRAGFFDQQRFPLADLLRRLQRRLTEEFSIPCSISDRSFEQAVLLTPPNLDRLHWIKWQYGPAQFPKSLFGVMGRIKIQTEDNSLLRLLVLGQFSGVGEKTAFGMGRYIIEEVQSALPDNVPRFLRAVRGKSLIELAMQQPEVEQEAQRLGESIGHVRSLARRVVDPGYEPEPVIRFLLAGAKSRLLSVPSRAERALQRGVHEILMPVLDRFLSDSCQAYRRGLGRKTAAERIHQAYRQGWRWALRSDFHHFFDSVDHALLREKLEVFIQDEGLVDLLMKWISAGAPQPGRGLPTGAVVSPMLANLFLVEFDEQVRQDGGFLVRYGDDFVLLFRDPNLGRTVLERANDWAGQLKLHLNNEKTKLLDLNQTPFDFLGYRFFSEKGWQYRGDGLKQIEDLGWHEAPKGREPVVRHPLPGEQGIETSRAGVWIVGPQIDWVGIEREEVVCRSQQAGTEDRFQRRRVSELIVLGAPTLDRSLFHQRGDESLSLLIADDAGRWTCAICDEPPLELPQLVRAQIELSDAPERSLGFGRQLVRAKLLNHAAVAMAYPARNSSGNLSQHLRSLAEKTANTKTEAELLGIEGAGAAAWYEELGRRIDRRFEFQRRVHPRADDPINVMLNLAQTVLHRLILLTLVREGFATSIGILHKSSERHAALASDLQEPYRHLMDRVVIELSYTLSPGEFHPTSQGPFALRMEAGTYRTVVAAVFKMLATEFVAVGQEAPRSYRRQMATMVRSLHRHLLNPDAKFKILEHY